MNRVELGDCRVIIPALIAEGVRVDSVVTDPPYHLESIVKRFGKPGSKPAKGAPHQRHARGFMGQRWDGGDVAFRPDTWRPVFEILRPGGFLLAFGGTRTYHRMVCAIEDAGFVIQDQIDWLYGSGFPKGRQHLKPAHEPICLAYKPAGKRQLGVETCRVPSAEPVQAAAGTVGGYGGSKTGHYVKGTGARYRELQVDECRVEGGDRSTGGDRTEGAWFNPKNNRRTLQVDECRVPAPEGIPVYETVHTGNTRHALGELKGSRRTGAVRGREPNANPHKQKPGGVPPGYSGGLGTAPRGWDGAEGRWPANVIHDGSQEVLEAFAAFGEGRAGGYPGIRGAGGIGTNGHAGQAGLEISRTDGGSVARFFYCPKAGPNDRWGSKHPTVKPLALVRYLVKLITPPGGLVLDPFAGSGTTAVAALAEGRDAIVIEADEGYIADIRERLAHYAGKGRHSLAAKARHRSPPAPGPLL